MTLGEPAGVRDPAQALFDTAMTGVDVCRLRRAGPRQDRIVEEKPVLVQARLVGLERQQVVAALLDDPGGDGLRHGLISACICFWIC